MLLHGRSQITKTQNLMIFLWPKSIIKTSFAESANLGIEPEKRDEREKKKKKKGGVNT